MALYSPAGPPCTTRRSGNRFPGVAPAGSVRSPSIDSLRSPFHVITRVSPGLRRVRSRLTIETLRSQASPGSMRVDVRAVDEGARARQRPQLAGRDVERVEHVVNALRLG